MEYHIHNEKYPAAPGTCRITVAEGTIFVGAANVMNQAAIYYREPNIGNDYANYEIDIVETGMDVDDGEYFGPMVFDVGRYILHAIIRRIY